MWFHIIFSWPISATSGPTWSSSTTRNPLTQTWCYTRGGWGCTFPQTRLRWIQFKNIYISITHLFLFSGVFLRHVSHFVPARAGRLRTKGQLLLSLRGRLSQHRRFGEKLIGDLSQNCWFDMRKALKKWEGRRRGHETDIFSEAPSDGIIFWKSNFK